MSGSSQANGCGCCEPAPEKPTMDTGSGQSRLTYRAGNHAAALRRMLAALDQALPALKVRTLDDPSTALLDSFATLADVVTFYTERIANEGYLRTATERRSVRELARAIGYELRPGAAAATVLSFTVLDAEGVPPRASVGAGLAARSVPPPDQVPQTYETDADLEAWAAGNAVPLQLRGPQDVGAGTGTAYLLGLDTGLSVGDAVLFAFDPMAPPNQPRQQLRLLSRVDPVPARGPGDVDSTTVAWTSALADAWPQGTKLHALRLRASLFGYNAPDFRTMADTVKAAYLPAPPAGADPDADLPDEWPHFALPDDPDGLPVLHLDQAYPKLQPGSWLVLRDQPDVGSSSELVCRVHDVQLSARADFGLTGRTTRVVLDTTADLSAFHRRSTIVFTASELLKWSGAPLPDEVAGSLLEVTTVEPFPLNQQVVVTGLTRGGQAVARRTSITDNDPVAGTVTLAEGLPGAPAGSPDSLLRASVRVLANVVTATHGETVRREVLGSGDGTLTFQRFTLKKPNLTHLNAGTTTGVQSTLQVRVGGVLWHQVSSLFLAGPRENAYVVRLGDDGEASVVFGDGLHGARLPTGQENVVARYRSGIGPVGDAPAGALTLLQQRPLAIIGVTNPLPATGGTAPEVLVDARRNAPLTVLTLDRVVSVGDHADFARAMIGVAKATAIVLWNGTTPFVHVTVAAPDALPMSEATLDHFRAAFDVLRDRARAVQLDDFEPLRFVVRVEVLVDPTLVSESVQELVRTALTEHFALVSRDFGQPVTASEILAAVHAVPGVTAARLTELRLTMGSAGVAEVLTARPATQASPAAVQRDDEQLGGEGTLPPSHVWPAQILLLGDDGVEVREMAR